MPKLYKPTYKDKRTGESRRSSCYYVRIRHADGVRRLVRLSPVFGAAKVMLARLIADIENERANPTTPLAAAAKKPLTEHLADWAAEMVAKGDTPKHVRQSLSAARKTYENCGAVGLADIEASAVRRFVAGLRQPVVDRGPLPPPSSPEGYAAAELARLIGLQRGSLSPLVRRHGLVVTGKGTARRYPAATAEALWARCGAGLSVRGADIYLIATKRFCAWAARDGRLRANPLAGLAESDPEGDRRLVYATLSLEELRALVDAARASAASFRGLTGADRVALYTLGLYTAFRPIELSRLNPADFRLDAEVPFVRLDGKRTKNGKPCDQALPPEVAREMAAYLEGKPAHEPVWGGSWHAVAAGLIGVDLVAAGIPFVKPGPDGLPLTVAFYSIRHSAGLLAEAGGATVRELMTLMRHSDPKLTLKVYGKLDMAGRAATVAKLPTLAAAEPGQNLANSGHKPGQTPRDEPGRAGNGAAAAESDGTPEVPQNTGEKDDSGRAGTGREAGGCRAGVAYYPLRTQLVRPYRRR